MTVIGMTVIGMTRAEHKRRQDARDGGLSMYV